MHICMDWSRYKLIEIARFLAAKVTLKKTLATAKQNYRIA